MNILASLFGKIESLSGKFKKNILSRTDDKYRAVNQWYNEDPNSLKRTSFDFLTADSVVFDLGGYKGEWTSDLFSRYACNIHVFEPVSQYAKIIRERFQKNPKISVYQFGLAENDSTAQISIDEFASKITTNGTGTGKTETIMLKEFNQFLQEKNIENIHLIKINIEGAEFPLLEHLLNSGTIKNIHTILVQFHEFIPGAVARREKIRKELAATHRLKFEYPFVWECWEKKL